MSVSQLNNGVATLSLSADSLNNLQNDLDCASSLKKIGNKITDGSFCLHCGGTFELNEKVVEIGESEWHTSCFVCAQCFQPFPNGIYYEFGDKKFCEHDFHVLFAPCCNKCGDFVIGRVIKAMGTNWHPDCFRCQICDTILSDTGFVKNAGRAICKPCNVHEKADTSCRYKCTKCHAMIEENKHLKFKLEFFHPYHFSCQKCGIELNVDAREIDGELYCLRCHDKMGIAICGACRRPIEERVVHALGKTWHVDHFVCSRCEKPFLGSRHYEKRGLAYCELHYQQLFGQLCFTCNRLISTETVLALNKAWCTDHFCCFVCDKKMTENTKFYKLDLKPVCKGCYDFFPTELRKRITKLHKQER